MMLERVSSFILLQVVDQFSQHHLLKSLPFSIVYSYPLLKDKVSIGTWIYLWAFYFVPLIYISVFVPDIFLESRTNKNISFQIYFLLSGNKNQIHVFYFFAKK